MLHPKVFRTAVASWSKSIRFARHLTRWRCGSHPRSAPCGRSDTLSPWRSDPPSSAKSLAAPAAASHSRSTTSARSRDQGRLDRRGREGLLERAEEKAGRQGQLDRQARRAKPDLLVRPVSRALLARMDRQARRDRLALKAQRDSPARPVLRVHPARRAPLARLGRPGLKATPARRVQPATLVHRAQPAATEPRAPRDCKGCRELRGSRESKV